MKKLILFLILLFAIDVSAQVKRSSLWYMSNATTINPLSSTWSLAGITNIGLSGNIVPSVTNTSNLGSASYIWNLIYGDTLSSNAVLSPYVIGGTASGGNLNLSSTTHATKGKIYFGTNSVYDEVNDRFGIETTSPTASLQINGTGVSNGIRFGDGVSTIYQSAPNYINIQASYFSIDGLIYGKHTTAWGIRNLYGASEQGPTISVFRPVDIYNSGLGSGGYDGSLSLVTNGISSIYMGTTGNVCIGGTNSLHKQSTVSLNSTNLNAFNFVNGSINLERSTVAQATDTSSVNLSFSSLGSPTFKITGKTGFTLLKVDSTTTTLSENILFADPGTSANSYSISLVADNSTTTQTGIIQVMYGADPYLRLSAPNDAGTATAIMDLKDQRVVIGSSGAGVDYDVYFQGETNQGSITYMEDEDRFDFDNDVDVVADLTAGTVTSDADVKGTSFTLSALQTPPASAAATGTAGQIVFGTDGYIYLCTATNTWVRVQLATW